MSLDFVYLFLSAQNEWGSNYIMIGLASVLANSRLHVKNNHRICKHILWQQLSVIVFDKVKGISALKGKDAHNNYPFIIYFHWFV